MAITNFKLTTSVNGCIVEDDNFKAIINAQSVNTTTGDIVSGSVQVQKKGTKDGVETAEYVGNYQVDEAGNINTHLPTTSGVTMTAFLTVVEAAIASVKAEILK